MPNTPAKHGRIRAWLVHMYTASGAVLAFAGAWGVVDRRNRLALAAMFAATIVDATDGMLARRARVKEVLPAIDGGRIDDIVDYITFVFLPLTLTLGSAWAAAIGAMIVLWPFPPRWLTIGSLAFPVYYLVLSLVLNARRERAGPAAPGPEDPACR